MTAIALYPVTIHNAYSASATSAVRGIVYQLTPAESNDVTIHEPDRVLELHPETSIGLNNVGTICFERIIPEHRPEGLNEFGYRHSLIQRERAYADAIDIITDNGHIIDARLGTTRARKPDEAVEDIRNLYVFDAAN